MEKETRSTTIVVAVIGLVATLGAAVVANWDKLFGPRVPSGAVTPGPSGGSSPSGSVHTACTPALAVPADGASVPQRRLDGGRVESDWMFGWRACPGATKYHLFVIGPSALNPIVDDQSITSATYHYRAFGYGITQRDSWTWKVRAFVDERWGDWSAQRTFSVAPPN